MRLKHLARKGASLLAMALTSCLLFIGCGEKACQRDGYETADAAALAWVHAWANGEWEALFQTIAPPGLLECAAQAQNITTQQCLDSISAGFAELVEGTRDEIGVGFDELFDAFETQEALALNAEEIHALHTRMTELGMESPEDVAVIRISCILSKEAQTMLTQYNACQAIDIACYQYHGRWYAYMV